MQQEIFSRVLDREVTAGEIEHALGRRIDEPERQDVLDLVRWFTTRYPTAEARLAYVRQAYARWSQRTARP